MSLSLNLFLKRVVLGGVVIFWAALGCSPEHDSTSTPDAEQVTYRDAQAIETDGVYQVDISEHILDIGTMTVGRDGRVYMTAPGAYEVLAFDAEGQYERRTGRMGQGPGEFEDEPEFLTYHDGSLYVNESLRKRSISIFDASLEFEKRVDIPFNVGILNFAVYNGELLVPLLEIEVSERMSPDDPAPSSFKLALLDTNAPGERQEPQFGALTEQQVTAKFWENLGFVRSHDDLVVFAYYFRGMLEVFDTAVSTHRVVELPIDGDLGIEEDDITGREIPTAAPIRAHSIDNEYIFVLGGTFNDELSQTVMVLNRLGDHIGNVALDAGGTEIESFDVRDGYIYYTTEDATMTKLRYDVEALSST